MKKIINLSLIVSGIFFLAGCGQQQTNQLLQIKTTQQSSSDILEKDKSQEVLNPNLENLSKKVDFNVYGFKNASNYYWATGDTGGPYYDELNKSINGIVSLKNDQQLNPNNSSSVIIIEQRSKGRFDKPDATKNTIEEISIANYKLTGFHSNLSSGAVRGWYILNIDEKTDILFAGGLYDGLDWNKILNDIIPNLARLNK